MAAEAGGPTEEPQPAPLGEEAGETAAELAEPELPAGADEYVETADAAEARQPAAEEPAERPPTEEPAAAAEVPAPEEPAEEASAHEPKAPPGS